MRHNSYYTVIDEEEVFLGWQASDAASGQDGANNPVVAVQSVRPETILDAERDDDTELPIHDAAAMSDLHVTVCNG